MPVETGAQPVHKRFGPATVTVLLAVYNGERWLRAKLESILALDYPRERMEILVVSDGSTDRTDVIAEEFAARRASALRSAGRRPPAGSGYISAGE
jgi:glycosyltransferase involved in cell wall biosynthesis